MTGRISKAEVKATGTTTHRSLADRFGDVVNIKDFESLVVGGDWGIAIQAAIDLGVMSMKPVYIPSGVYSIGERLNLTGSLTLIGDGQYLSIISKQTTVEGDSVLNKADSLATYEYLSISGVCLSGGLLGSDYQEVNGSIISGRNIRKVRINNSTIKNGRGFGINLNVCDDVMIMDNTVEMVYRDAIAIWNSKLVHISNNTIEHNDDDGISISRSVYEPSESIERSGIVVEGNLLRDSGGIRTQGCIAVSINNNILERIKSSEAAIFIGSLPFGEANYQNPNTIKAVNNIITDRLDRNLSSGAPLTENFRGVIKVESTRGLLSGLPAIPRDIDISLGVVQSPYSYINTFSGELNDKPIGRGEFIIIEGNTVKRTLPAVTNYSDWGYGQMFSRFSGTGWVNPEITDTALAMIPVDIEGPVRKLFITKNILSGSGSYGINFKKLFEDASVQNYDLDEIEIKGNYLSDNLKSGVNLNPYSGTNQRVVISGNTIDNDPYFRSANRVESLGVKTGGWNLLTSSVGVATSSVSGVEILNNRFRNCSSPYIQGGAADSIVKLNNILYAQPTTIGFDVSNLGVGNIPNDCQFECKLVYEDSDPTNVTYKTILESTVYTVAGNSPPSSGFYVAGVFVVSRGISPTTKNGETQAIHGFKRLTTGASHILGVDWQPVWFET